MESGHELNADNLPPPAPVPPDSEDKSNNDEAAVPALHKLDNAPLLPRTIPAPHTAALAPQNEALGIRREVYGRCHRATLQELDPKISEGHQQRRHQYSSLRLNQRRIRALWHLGRQQTLRAWLCKRRPPEQAQLAHEHDRMKELTTHRLPCSSNRQRATEIHLTTPPRRRHHHPLPHIRFSFPIASTTPAISKRRSTNTIFDHRRRRVALHPLLHPFGVACFGSCSRGIARLCLGDGDRCMEVQAVQNGQPLAQHPIPLVPQPLPVAPHQPAPPPVPQAANPAVAQPPQQVPQAGVAPGAQDIVMGPAMGDGNINQDGDMAVDVPENPHLQTTMMLPLTTVPPRPGKGYSGGPFPKTVITSDDLLKSIRAEILDNILREPDEFLLLRPYGAGRRLHAEYPNLGEEILEYINEFRTPNCERLAIVRAATDTYMRGGKPKMYTPGFEAPWVFIMSGFSAELRDFLLGVEVFDFVAGEANHAFTVLKVETNVGSWHVAYLSGDGVAGGQQAMSDGLSAIKTKLKDDTKVRTAIQECYAERTDKLFASTDEKVEDAPSTLAITFTEDGPAKYWHLTAKPITNDDKMHRNWLIALRERKSFVINKIFAVEVKPGFARCDFCKNESHPESACPFPKAQGWKGPKPCDVRARWARANRRDEGRREGGQWTASDRDNRNERDSRNEKDHWADRDRRGERDHRGGRGHGRGGRGRGGSQRQSARSY
ncbi:hypothetical protein BDN71DRAFT_1594757 [Pleurotus eryngii]|uniref:Uncharacterized protein n=1 Tax=Pleurotus eryngii TaxID=5323 RepID=A0A9P6D7Q3_PLEER|nr:hypothetical protein BDN71DRAFT_1594757 [Pleurotus eryngii]